MQLAELMFSNAARFCLSAGIGRACVDRPGRSMCRDDMRHMAVLAASSTIAGLRKRTLIMELWHGQQAGEGN